MLWHVPDRIVCPRCNSKGLVRHENVIKGDKVERHYYCGACNYSWRVTYDGEKAERPPQPKRDRSE
jgi:transposase-like protein